VCLGIGGDEVKFDAKGDGLGKYDIFQYQNVQDNRYNYVRVGEWVDRWVDRHCFFRMSRVGTRIAFGNVIKCVLDMCFSNYLFKWFQ